MAGENTLTTLLFLKSSDNPLAQIFPAPTISMIKECLWDHLMPFNSSGLCPATVLVMEKNRG